jgi:hypothetical protein
MLDALDPDTPALRFPITKKERKGKMKHKLFCTSGIIALAMLAFTTSLANAQTTSNGPYYANPSWDQQLQCDAQATCPRFIVLSNWSSEAVLDRETGLVWERSLQSLARVSWFDAISACEGLIVANRRGWRLPSVQELSSLLDLTQSNPSLPPGNPFQRVVTLFGSVFWTAATLETDATVAKAINFSDGSITQGTKFLPLPLVEGSRYWCVRGGSSVSNPPY